MKRDVSFVRARARCNRSARRVLFCVGSSLRVRTDSARNDTPNGDGSATVMAAKATAVGGSTDGPSYDGNSHDGTPAQCTPLVGSDGSSPRCASCTDDDGDGLVDWLHP